MAEDTELSMIQKFMIILYIDVETREAYTSNKSS